MQGLGLHKSQYKNSVLGTHCTQYELCYRYMSPTGRQEKLNNLIFVKILLLIIKVFLIYSVNMQCN